MQSLTSLSPFLLGILSVFFLVPPTDAWAQQNSLNSDYQSPAERDVFQTLPGQQDKKSLLDATNPMDLLNQLRRANSMNDATPPSDAIDAALKALESSPNRLLKLLGWSRLIGILIRY